MGAEWALDSYKGSTQSGLRHGGRWNVAYCDGHAKNLLFLGGTISGHRYAFPSDNASRSYYCADPNATIDLSYYGFGSDVCGNIINDKIAPNMTYYPN